MKTKLIITALISTFLLTQSANSKDITGHNPHTGPFLFHFNEKDETIICSLGGTSCVNQTKREMTSKRLREEANKQNNIRHGRITYTCDKLREISKNGFRQNTKHGRLLLEKWKRCI